MDKVEANSLQVRVELQADCLAGIWANRAQEKWQFTGTWKPQCRPLLRSAMIDCSGKRKVM